MRSHLLVVALALLSLLSVPVGARTEMPTLPVDFFVERDRPVVAVVRVESIQTSLRISREVGERFYFSLVTARVETSIRGTGDIRPDRPLVFAQPEFMAVRPYEQRPPLIGRTYVAWLDKAIGSEQTDLGAALLAERGCLMPVYGSGAGRYIEWSWPCSGTTRGRPRCSRRSRETTSASAARPRVTEGRASATVPV